MTIERSGTLGKTLKRITNVITATASASAIETKQGLIPLATAEDTQ